MGKNQDSQILLSVCIPTFNRAKLLQECLTSIIRQFKSKNVYANVEIVISNNNSPDHTEKIVRRFQKKYKNIRYFRNIKNIGTANTIKVASYARGKYIWFFSDDDWHKKNSIATVIKVIKEKRPDLILCNLDLYSKNGKHIQDANLLRIGSRDFYGKKREFFHFLEDKFFLPIDWYLTAYSNTIMKKEVIAKNYPILDKYKGKRFVFPQKYFTFFTSNNFLINVIAKPIINFRADNRSFGPRDKKEFLVDWYKTLKIHYDKIYEINKKYISWKFTFLLFIKQFLRSVRLKFLLLFSIDISDFLIKYFYKKTKN